MKDPDRHFPFVLEIVGEPDPCHAADAELPFEAIVIPEGVGQDTRRIGPAYFSATKRPAPELTLEHVAVAQAGGQRS